MRNLGCWRCKGEVPMLDEEEFKRVISLVHTHGEGASVQGRFHPMLAEYQQITGFREENPNAIWHYRLSLYGPPCKHCGKPLRTPKAKICGSCMQTG